MKRVETKIFGSKFSHKKNEENSQKNTFLRVKKLFLFDFFFRKRALSDKSKKKIQQLTLWEPLLIIPQNI